MSDSVPAAVRAAMSSVAVAAMFLVTAGCTTLASMRPDDGPPKGGVLRSYKYPLEEIFEAARQAAGALELSVEEENTDNNYLILRSMGRTNYFFVNYGERVGVYFRELEDGRVAVRIVSKRIYKPGFLYYEDWSEEFHARLSGYLAG